LAIALTGLASGWATTRAQQPVPARPQAEKQAPPSLLKKLTLTGCLERSDQFSASGVPSPIAATVDSQSFVLIRAAQSPIDAAPAAVGTTGSITAGDNVTKAASRIGHMYKLDGDASVLNPHVGHRVEVLGIIDPTSPVGRPPDPQNPSAATAPVLMVESVKMISDLCPR
jgi:hypothetical protein